jgi:hypothetical protein
MGPVDIAILTEDDGEAVEVEGRKNRGGGEQADT